MLVEQTDIQAIISIFGEEDILAELEKQNSGPEDTCTSSIVVCPTAAYFINGSIA